MNRPSVVTLAILVGGSLLARPATAHAFISDGAVAALVAAGILLPAHVGADIPAGGETPTRVVVGWSVQIPFSHRGLFDGHSHHSRVVLGGDLLLGEGTGGRARIGYRYSTHWLFAGAGVTLNASGVTWSPELGVKFAHFINGELPSLHLLVRGEIEPDLQRVRSAMIVLGWSVL